MKHYAWNAEKNELLKKERGISFEDVVFHIGAGDVMDIFEHPNQERGLLHHEPVEQLIFHIPLPRTGSTTLHIFYSATYFYFSRQDRENKLQGNTLTIERNKRIAKTVWVGVVAKFTNAGISLLIVPLAIHYLGTEKYGLWLAISSLVAMLSFLDGGAGNSVINLTAQACGKPEKELTAKIISSAFYLLAVISVVGFIITAAASYTLPWRTILGLSDTISDVLVQKSILIVGAFFFSSMPITMIGKVQRGLQEGYLDHACATLGGILSLLFVYSAIQMDAGLLGVIIGFVSGPLTAYLLNNIYYFFVLNKDIRPRISRVDTALIKTIFSIGFMFFILQIASTVQMQADNVIIANLLGVGSVPDYAVPMKMFVSIAMLFQIAFTPLWPAYRESISSGDAKWAINTFLKSLKIALLISVPAAIVLIIFGKEIIAFWTGNVIVPSYGLLIGMGIWFVFLAVGNALAMFLNAIQLLKVQVSISVISALANIAISIILIRRFGIEGAIYGTILAYFIFALLPYTYIIPKALLNLQTRSDT